jgi:hypothetical protein
VVEAARPDELDAFEWYCFECQARVHRVEVKVRHLVKDLPPLYEAFFDLVRDVNLRLPKEKRMRIILGDAPLDFARLRENPSSRTAETRHITGGAD